MAMTNSGRLGGVLGQLSRASLCLVGWRSKPTILRRLTVESLAVSMNSLTHPSNDGAN